MPTTLRQVVREFYEGIVLSNVLRILPALRERARRVGREQIAGGAAVSGWVSSPILPVAVSRTPTRQISSASRLPWSHGLSRALAVEPAERLLDEPLSPIDTIRSDRDTCMGLQIYCFEVSDGRVRAVMAVSESM